MTYEYYNTFLYVAKYKSATRAAKELYTSQPAVTRTIKLLETELGCSLFVRSKNGMELTKEGETLYQYVSNAFSTIAKGEELVSQSISIHGGEIAIGTTITALDEFLFEYLEGFHKLYPKIKYKISTQSSDQTVQKLKSGLIDIAFITTPYKPNSDLTVKKIKEFDNVIIGGKKYEYLKGKKLKLEDLKEIPFIHLSKEMQLREYTDGILLKHNMEVETTIEVDSAHMIIPMVKNNLGIGITPLSLAKDAIDNGSVFAFDLKEPLPKREVVVLINKSYPQSTLVREFLSKIE